MLAKLYVVVHGLVNDDIPEVKLNSSYLLLVFAVNCVLIDFRWAFQCAVSPMWYKMRMNIFVLPIATAYSNHIYLS
jgi:hypothetical protein